MDGGASRRVYLANRERRSLDLLDMNEGYLIPAFFPAAPHSERDRHVDIRRVDLYSPLSPKVGMPKTVEAIVDDDGRIRLPSSISVRTNQRVLITILDENASSDSEESTDLQDDFRLEETTLLSEDALAKDWMREEEEEARKHLQPDP